MGWWRKLFAGGGDEKKIASEQAARPSQRPDCGCEKEEFEQSGGIVQQKSEPSVGSADDREDKGAGSTTGTPDGHRLKKYYCDSILCCGYVHDPAVGDPRRDIPPGTPFESIRDEWCCPRCNFRKELFRSEDEIDLEEWERERQEVLNEEVDDGFKRMFDGVVNRIGLEADGALEPVHDANGNVVGFWLGREVSSETLQPLLKAAIAGAGEAAFLSVSLGEYRTVANSLDDRGGQFIMLGDARAPGEEEQHPERVPHGAAVQELSTRLLSQNTGTREEALQEALAVSEMGQHLGVLALTEAIRAKSGKTDCPLYEPSRAAVRQFGEVADAKASLLRLAADHAICREAFASGRAICMLGTLGLMDTPDDVQALLADIERVGGQDQLIEFQLVGTHTQAVAKLTQATGG